MSRLQRGITSIPVPGGSPIIIRGCSITASSSTCRSKSSLRTMKTLMFTPAKLLVESLNGFVEIGSDFDGYIAELLAKANSQSKLDGTLTADEKDGLLQILRSWGALDKNYQYRKSNAASGRRGFEIYPGGGRLARVRLPPIPCRCRSCSSQGCGVRLGAGGHHFSSPSAVWE